MEDLSFVHNFSVLDIQEIIILKCKSLSYYFLIYDVIIFLCLVSLVLVLNHYKVRTLYVGLAGIGVFVFILKFLYQYDLYNTINSLYPITQMIHIL